MGQEAADDSNWSAGNYGTAEILIGFTDAPVTGGTGCINTIPGSGGTHPYIVVSLDSTDIPRTVMHELTHAYGFSHTSTCTNIIPGVMAVSCGNSLYVKNWIPADDTTMENRRSWY